MKRIYYEVFCMFVGGAIRFLYCLKYSIPTRDSFKYSNLIKEWSTTDLIPIGSGTPPFMLYLTKTVHEITNYSIIKCGVAINVVFGILLIVIAMKITWKLTELSVLALCTGLLVATSPTLVDYSCQFLRECSFLLFAFLVLLSIINYIKWKKTSSIVAMGACSCLAYLCRHEALEYIPFVFFVILTIQMPLNNRIKRIGLYCLTFIIVFMTFSLIAKIPLSYYSFYSERMSDKITTNPL